MATLLRALLFFFCCFVLLPRRRRYGCCAANDAPLPSSFSRKSAFVGPVVAATRRRRSCDDAGVDTAVAAAVSAARTTSHSPPLRLSPPAIRYPASPTTARTTTTTTTTSLLSATGTEGVSSGTEGSKLILFGHPGTRSPLINWACHELKLGDDDFVMASDLSKNPHPFGQIPCLVDGDVVVFESGAILLYLHHKYRAGSRTSMTTTTDKANGAVTSWITWANASLDPICFVETPEGKVYDTKLRQPNRRVERLDGILRHREWLVADNEDGSDAEFTLADVAVSSYLLYVVQFFPDPRIWKFVSQEWPNVARYMLECASRPAYGEAFGQAVQASLVGKLRDAAAEGAAAAGAPSPENDVDDRGQIGNPKKKLFGMF